MKEEENKRKIFAPVSDGIMVPGAVISIEVEEDQDVEWIWTHYSDGRNAVTGFRLVLRKPNAA